MGKKRTVLKVNNSSSKKSQKEIVSAVAKIEGVEKLEMDGNRGTLTVVGDVEPVPIFKALKKINRSPEIVSVGPPRPQKCGPYCTCSSCQSYSNQQQRWWDAPVNPCRNCNRPWCNQCELVAVGYPPSSAYDSGMCSIQ